MKKSLTLIIVFTFLAQLSHSQIIDRYGINIGTSYSNTIWDFTNNDYKLGLMAFIQTEKDFGDILALRAELGYIQRGFKNNITLTSGDGTFFSKNNDNVIFHDLDLNLGLKIKPFKFNYSPYLLLGIRSDYMMSYKDIVTEEPGSNLTFNMFESMIEEFGPLSAGGIIGIGIDIEELVYLEIEYNPSFKRKLDNINASRKDICWGAKVGLNINKLVGE